MFQKRDFLFTKFSQQLKSTHKAKLEHVKKSIGSIFNEKSTNIVQNRESLHQTPKFK